MQSKLIKLRWCKGEEVVVALKDGMCLADSEQGPTSC
jgi:hypothetical protein